MLPSEHNFVYNTPVFSFPLNYIYILRYGFVASLFLIKPANSPRNKLALLLLLLLKGIL